MYNPAMRSYLSIFILCALMVGACTTRPPGIGSPVEWSSLESWESDNHSDAWAGFLKSCQKLDHEQWRAVCDLAENSGDLGDAEAREFFESHFEVRPVYAKGGETQGLITGYYEPLLKGSWERSEEYQYPLYGVPEDLLVVDLGAVYPQLKGMRLRGKLVGNKVVPYHDRAQLDDDQELLQGAEILWVNSSVDLFFLHVQGSGLVELADGSIAAVGYAEQNGHPYQSIGRVLIEMGELEKEEVTQPELCLFRAERRPGKRADRRAQRGADAAAQYCGRSQCDSVRRTRMVADHTAERSTIATEPTHVGAGYRWRHQGSCARRCFLGPRRRS